MGNEHSSCKDQTVKTRNRRSFSSLQPSVFKRSSRTGSPVPQPAAPATAPVFQEDATDAQIECLIWKKSTKSIDACSLCDGNIRERRMLMMETQANGNMSMTSRGAAGAVLHAYCARCNYVYFCSFCHDILREAEIEIAEKLHPEMLDCLKKAGSDGRHPYCPKCCTTMDEYTRDKIDTMKRSFEWEIVDEFDEFKQEKICDKKKCEEIKKLRALRNVSCDAAVVATSLEKDFDNANLWADVGAVMTATQHISVRGKTYTKVEVLERALSLRPLNLQVAHELMLFGNAHGTYNIAGEELRLCDIAAKIVERFPTNSTARRNTALLMHKTCAKVEVLGAKMTRDDVVVSAAACSKSQAEKFATAFSLRDEERLLKTGEETYTRKEGLRMGLDVLKPEQSLEDISDVVGNLMLTVICELALIHPDHPKVIEYGNRFHIGKNMLGSGAYGQVFDAELRVDEETTVPLAAKIIKYNPATLTSINKDAELMFSACPAIQEYTVKTHFMKFDPESKQVTIYMDRAANGSLHQRLVSQGHRFHEEMLRLFLVQLLQALTMLHGYDIVHQDIKPQNVLSLEGPTVRLADLGLARFSDKFKDCKQRSQVGGTYVYMPPEAVHHERVTAAGDIWSLAVTIVELATGALHADPEHVLVESEPPHRPYVPDHLSKDCRSLLARMLEIDPQTRITATEALALPYCDITKPLPDDAETPAHFAENANKSGVPDVVASGSIYETVESQGLSGDISTVREFYYN